MSYGAIEASQAKQAQDAARAQQVAASRGFVAAAGQAVMSIGTTLVGALGNAYQSLRAPRFNGKPAVPAAEAAKNKSGGASATIGGGSDVDTPKEALEALRDHHGAADVKGLGTKHMTEDVMDAINKASTQGEWDAALDLAKEELETEDEENPADEAASAEDKPAPAETSEEVPEPEVETTESGGDEKDTGTE